MEKMCSVCNVIKNKSFFHKENRRKIGVRSNCKECESFLRKTKYKERIKNYNENKYLKNKKEMIESYNNYSKNRDEGLFRKYLSMVRRCKYPSQSQYKYYGGKGIKVEWKSYIEFKNDMYISFLEHMKIHGHKNTTLERENNNENYSKQNCRWATLKEQSENRTNSKKYHNL